MWPPPLWLPSTPPEDNKASKEEVEDGNEEEEEEEEEDARSAIKHSMAAEPEMEDEDTLESRFMLFESRLFLS
jgi:hypothetical protein